MPIISKQAMVNVLETYGKLRLLRDHTAKLLPDGCGYYTAELIAQDHILCVLVGDGPTSKMAIADLYKDLRVGVKEAIRNIEEDTDGG